MRGRIKGIHLYFHLIYYYFIFIGLSNFIVYILFLSNPVCLTLSSRLILLYLIPIQAMFSKFPKPRLLQKYNLPQFIDILTAVKQGTERERREERGEKKGAGGRFDDVAHLSCSQVICERSSARWLCTRTSSSDTAYISCSRSSGLRFTEI